MSATSFNAELGKNQFLQLLATQLQNQDPMQPVGQQEFLQQLAQFATVEGIENLNNEFKTVVGKLDQLVETSGSTELSQLQLLNSGAGLLGKSVRYGDASGDVGVVSEIKPDSGQVLVRIGSTFMPMSDIQGIATSVSELSN